jgi:redox-sensitive bicupin YhaK (pirin superfamily)
MKTVLHRSDSRGRAEHGWLHSRHTFSFAEYYDPERMGFGALRVINDDVVAPGMGFGAHAHDNMEIISIPLSGSLRHEDSVGNTQVIRSGEVQSMSAGTGIRHSEYNASDSDPVNFLQIWVIPKQRDIAPRYDQQEFPAQGRQNRFQTVVAGDSADGAMWVNQDAWFSLGSFSAGHRETYRLHKKENVVYLFVIEGEVTAAGERLNRRDGFGITGSHEVEIVASNASNASNDSQLLLMEVPS